MLPRTIKWPIGFAGFLVKAWLLYEGAILGYRLGQTHLTGYRPGLWGALVGFVGTFIIVGVVLFTVKRALARVAERLAARIAAEVNRMEAEP